jgi:hypothetical protein
MPVDVCILRQTDLGDCTNGGVSAPTSGNKYLTLIGENDPMPENPRFPVVRVHKRWVGSPNEYICAKDAPRKGVLGPMAGGNFVWSRGDEYMRIVGHCYPISLHDRFETQEDYDALTR